ncbi:intracellular signaling protein [Gracilibacillus boraciitolerans JCM 21714]|uniref:Intracellular signaling protein n=1 Tax=Gracilibacillus boraciitolerans JCM 21714 TaxID=1298598 RepID=W4VMN1_9BACI|nr:intracellular signaling protein [Gracilibacillus boraciitolerans JCM 21714]
MPSPFSYKELITLLNQIPDPMFITEAKKDGFLHIIEANDAAVEHMKYTKDELLTMSPFDLVESDFLKKATINHTELKRGKVLELESIHVTKEGKNVPVNLKLKQVNFTDKNPYVITLFNDISDKHHTEALLKNTHQQLEALFDYNPDLIFMMDNEGYFINTNPANYRILKYTKEEMLLKNFSDVVYPDDMELTNEHFQLVLNKQSVQVELRVLDKQQNILILDVTAVPIITKDKVAGIIGIARDISEEKRMSNALQESEQRYRSIYENNIDAVLSFDLNGRFSYMNKATED